MSEEKISKVRTLGGIMSQTQKNYTLNCANLAEHLCAIRAISAYIEDVILANLL